MYSETKAMGFTHSVRIHTYTMSMFSVVVRMMMIKLSGLQVRIIINSRLYFTSSFPVPIDWVLLHTAHSSHVWIEYVPYWFFGECRTFSFRLRRLEWCKIGENESACVVYVFVGDTQTTANHFIYNALIISQRIVFYKLLLLYFYHFDHARIQNISTIR